VASGISENRALRSRVTRVVKDYERMMKGMRGKTTKNQAVMPLLMLFCFEIESRFA
jgi:hypothetical protein